MEAHSHSVLQIQMAFGAARRAALSTCPSVVFRPLSSISLGDFRRRVRRERASERAWRVGGGVASSASPLDALPPAPRLPLLAIQLPRIAVAVDWRAMMAERETERRVSKGNQLCFASRLNWLRDD